MKKISYAFTIIFCLVLIGCGKKETKMDIDLSLIEVEMEECHVPDLTGAIATPFQADGGLYTGVYNKALTVEEGRYQMVRYDITTGEVTRTKLLGKDQMIMWTSMKLHNGNYKALFMTRDPEEGTFGSYTIMTFDPSGDKIDEVELANIVPEDVLSQLILDKYSFDREGNFYFFTQSYGKKLETMIYKVGTDGKMTTLRKCSDSISGIYEAGGSMYIPLQKMLDATIEIYEIKEGEETLELIAEIPQSGDRGHYASITPGKDADQLIVYIDENCYLYQKSSKQLTGQFSMEGCSAIMTGVSNDYYVLKWIGQTEDNRILNDWIHVWQSENPSQKQLITIAVDKENTLLKEAVASYNKSSEQYKAVIKVYDDDMKARLQGDIAVGNGPDMISVDLVDVEAWAQKGMLHDITDFMNAQGMTKDNFVGRSIEIYQSGDQIYALPIRLGLIALSGKSKYIQDAGNLDFEEWKHFVNGLPDAKAATAGISKNTMLEMTLETGLDHFVNWEDLTCSFTDGEFAALLEYMDQYADQEISAEKDPEKLTQMLHDDEILLYPTPITSSGNMQFMKALWGDLISYVGFPSKDGGKIRLTDVSGSLVIMESSPYKEEVWKILQTMVTSNETRYGGIPAYKPSFEQMILALEEESGADESIYEQIPVGDMLLDLIPLTIEEIRELEKMVAEAQPAAPVSEEIQEIVREEVQSFFAHQKGAEEVSDSIQNRVLLYLKE